MSHPQTPSASTSVPNFRLPAQPTILLKAPSDETVVRLRQLAPYYWSHPQTTNCSIRESPLNFFEFQPSEVGSHQSPFVLLLTLDFPIDIRTQQRIQSYQVRQRQQQVASGRTARGSSMAGSSSHHGDGGRRGSLTPAVPGTTPGRSPSVSRQGSSARLRAVYSGRDLNGSAARAAILGNETIPTSPTPMGDGSFPRRGSLTPGYDPFSTGKTSIVVTSSATSPAGSEAKRDSLAPAPNMGRRGSVTVVGANGVPAQMKSVRLHVEYLTAQSALIRQVLAQAAGYQPVPDSSGPPTPAASPTSTRQSISPSPSSAPPNPFPHSFFRFSPHRYPRVIQPPSATPAPTATAPGAPPAPHVGPTIILPVPDPASFPILIHYMYHGSMDPIERSLKDGTVTWEGLVRNVEYLGLREEVKRFLGKWWRSWREREGVEGRSAQNNDDDDDDDDEARKGYPYGGDLRMDMDDDALSSGWSSPTSTAGGGTTSLDDEMAGLLGKF
ncbi:hypothetical protein FRB95_014863 [Tulasnella sp. JGI-2019a]|nr:hypothetical protein FRB95_014863 [Tulasnella sp. JGI-2019a]